VQSLNFSIPVGSLSPSSAQDLILITTGIFLPWLIAACNDRALSNQNRVVVALLFCLAAASAECWLTGQLAVVNVADACVKIAGAAIVTYHRVWKAFGITSFEEKTSAALDKLTQGEAPAGESEDEHE